MKFVIATDGSDASERALDHALELAADTDWQLTLVHAVNPNVYDIGGVDPAGDRSETAERLILEGVDDAERRGERLLEEGASHAAEVGFEVDTELLYGHPVEAISSFTTTEGYDGVFVGHRGLSEKHERVLGSVAKGLIERSSVPVTVVR